LTIIDRLDARTRDELERLAEGIMTKYKSSGGQILAARTLRDASGTPFNYMVAALMVYRSPDHGSAGLPEKGEGVSG